MFDELDDFSKRIASQVIEKFPQWQSLAKVKEKDGETAFSVTVTPPSGEYEHPLTLHTFLEEVTVAFDAYHAHFWEFDDPDSEDALTFINQLLSDELPVVSYWRDDQWCGSTVLRESELPSTNAEFPYANRIRIRSWSGQQDRDLPCAV